MQDWTSAAASDLTELTEPSYDLLARIHAGSTTTVHVGRRRGAPASPLLAIKRLRSHLAASAEARRVLFAEAAVASRLRHPNAVAAHAVEDTGDDLFLVMDYIEGASVADLVRVWPLLAPPVAVRMLLDAAAGLAALHALADERGRPLGLVHRAVSPDNLVVGLDGRTRISDFGLVRRVSADVPEKRGRLGRCAYVAPEHAKGNACDARADVYSLAVVAWELLAARPLFEAGSDAATLQRVMTAEAPALSSVFPEIGEAFDPVLERALDKDPSRRHGSIEELAAQLWDAATWSGGIASPFDVGIAVEELVGDALACRREDVEDQSSRRSGVYRCRP